MNHKQLIQYWRITKHYKNIAIFFKVKQFNMLIKYHLKLIHYQRFKMMDLFINYICKTKNLELENSKSYNLQINLLLEEINLILYILMTNMSATTKQLFFLINLKKNITCMIIQVLMVLILRFIVKFLNKT